MFFSFKKINLIRHDSLVLELLHKFSKPFVIRLIGVVFNLGFTLFVSRLLGASGAGLYFLCLTIVMISSVFGRLGLDNTMLRLISSAVVNDKWSIVSSIYRTSLGVSFVASSVLSLVLFIFSHQVAQIIFKEQGLIQPLQLMILAIIPCSLLILQAEAFKAVSLTPIAIFLQNTGVPLFCFVALAIVGIFSPTIISVCQINVISCFLILIGAMLYWHKWLPVQKERIPVYPIKSLLAISTPLFWVSAMNLIMGWMDTLMLGIWHETAVVGLYGIANRVAATIGLLLAVLNSVVAPRFSSLYSQGKLKEIQMLVSRSQIIMIVMGLPILLLYFFFSNYILIIFGSKFIEASSMLKILSVGQFINIATGSVGYLLIMTGHEKIMRNIIFSAASLNFLLNIILVPYYGGVGAAFATAITLSFMNLLSLYYSKNVLKINIFKKF